MSFDINDPSIGPELRAMILRVQREYDALTSKYYETATGAPPVASVAPPVSHAARDAPYANPGRLAPRSVSTAPAAGPVAAQMEADPVEAFDRNVAFGPRIGMTRLARFQRAVAFGDAPDPRVLEAIRARPALGSYVYRA